MLAPAVALESRRRPSRDADRLLGRVLEACRFRELREVELYVDRLLLEASITASGHVIDAENRVVPATASA